MMNGAAAGTTLLVLLVAVVGGAFLSVVSIVAMVKILQIAEDLRWLRSKSDIHVERPKSYKNTLAVCLVVAAIVSLLMLGVVMTSATAIQGLSAVK